MHITWKKNIKLTPEVKKALFGYHWPGNVRELENVIERALVLCSGHEITLKDIPDSLTEKEEEKIDLNRIVPLNLPLPEALEQLEEKLIRRALDYTENVQSRAAEMLGISRHVMHYKMKKYEILQ